MANWTRATTFKRVIEVVSEELGFGEDQKAALMVSPDTILDGMTAAELIDILKSAVMREAISGIRV